MGPVVRRDHYVGAELRQEVTGLTSPSIPALANLSLLNAISIRKVMAILLKRKRPDSKVIGGALWGSLHISGCAAKASWRR